LSDAAQERGEIRANGERSFSSPEKVSGTEVVDPKLLHEARVVRDAEEVARATSYRRRAKIKPATKAAAASTFRSNS
jgi:hypothetical protein